MSNANKNNDTSKMAEETTNDLNKNSSLISKTLDERKSFHVMAIVLLWVFFFLFVLPVLSFMPKIGEWYLKWFLSAMLLLCVGAAVLINGLIPHVAMGGKNIPKAVLSAVLVSIVAYTITYIALSIDAFMKGHLVRMFENSIGYFMVKIWFKWLVRGENSLQEIFRTNLPTSGEGKTDSTASASTTFTQFPPDYDFSFLLTMFSVDDFKENAVFAENTGWFQQILNFITQLFSFTSTKETEENSISIWKQNLGKKLASIHNIAIIQGLQFNPEKDEKTATESVGDNTSTTQPPMSDGEKDVIRILKRMVFMKHRVGNAAWFFLTSIFAFFVNFKFLLSI